MEIVDYSKYYWKNDFIRLRQPAIDDWEYLISNMYDSENRFFFDDEIELPIDIENYKKNFIEKIEQNDSSCICLAIEDCEGKHVGIANIFGIDERNGVFGPIGIQINVGDRNKGYGIAALRMLAIFMFNERRMHKWNSGYMQGNTSSEKLHKKLGFNIEGVRKDVTYHDGKYWGEVLCGITREEFFENEKQLR